jgi:hypothetical protein
MPILNVVEAGSVVCQALVAARLRWHRQRPGCTTGDLWVVRDAEVSLGKVLASVGTHLGNTATPCR